MSLVPDRDVSPPVQGAKLTIDELWQLPDDGMRHELIAGEHHVSPPPNLKHQAVIGVIYFFLHQHVRQFGGGRVYMAPTGVVLSDADAVEPDILFVGEARLGILVPKFVHGAPDLVVEVGSPSTRRRDLRDKLHLYERSGVTEYWFADPELDSVTVYRLVDGRFVRAADLSRDARDTLTSPLLPGLAIPLAEIFAE